MKILYVNFAYDTWGHKNLDENYIRILSRFAQVWVIARKGWYNSLPDNVTLVEYNPQCISEKCNNKILKHVLSVLVMNFSRELLQKEKFDYLIAGTFDTLTLVVAKKWFLPECTYIMHHNNTDLLSRTFYKIVFNSYKNRFYYIVQEKFIKDQLVRMENLETNKVVILPHPVNVNKKENSKDKIYDYVGISNSNDENAVKELIRLENAFQFLKKGRVTMLLRSKKEEYSDDYLTVIKGYLSSEQYEKYISNAKCILILFPDSFKYRESGSIIDALSNKIPVVGSNILIVKEYSDRYPNICKVYNNIQELPHLLKELEMISDEEKEKDFSRFIEEHSDGNIMETAKRFLSED